MSWEAEGVTQRRFIDRGLALLVGAGPSSTPEATRRLADKVANLRIFPDSAGRINLSLLDIAGEVLAVSQFTLYADFSRGRRPSFLGAGDPGAAREHYEALVTHLRASGVRVETGSFGAAMLLTVENEGPFTLALSSDDWPTRV